MRIAVGQFAASPDWKDNLTACIDLAAEADQGGADLLVLPEGVLARFTEDRHRIREVAQPLGGPFVTELAAATARSATSIVVGIHEPSDDGRVFNTLVVLRAGELIARYRKIHLYDAFGDQESANVRPADEPPVVVEVAGTKVGLMTCYDVRFPELARLLTDAGAEVLVLPAAWVRGPAKERHWEVMVTARALENTCWVAASGECGPRNIGNSLIVDPLGTVRSRLAAAPGLAWAEADPGVTAAARGTLPVLANRRFAVDPTVRPLGSLPLGDLPLGA
ncbi:carbon-nitrogen hydrolase family protein [Streptomyces sp. KM273126]|uniref:nitrilase-related carbon-nitrogen hydrolase n=1 Tax=Streptomyces sp. KM273126 TaxID=2545247 RepID=UPI0010388AD7|nr:nitrilase-related carbon-nitrogen hydrolase [Streptomyces sp. KM273126]MBA2807917.1 carbon-nitrogen hydrolase family protein [Streptomyces sp. KM273126]